MSESKHRDNIIGRTCENAFETTLFCVQLKYGKSNVVDRLHRTRKKKAEEGKNDSAVLSLDDGTCFHTRRDCIISCQTISVIENGKCENDQNVLTN